MLSIDITERKRMAEELEMEARLLNAATDAIILHDDEGRLLYFNDAAYTSLGYSREEMARLTVPELLPIRDRDLYVEGIRTFDNVENATFETTGLRKDGTLMSVEVHAHRMELGNARYILSVVRDITERRRMNEELEREAHLLDAALDSIVLHEPGGTIVYFNEGACKLLGYSRDELAQLSMLDLLSPDAGKQFSETSHSTEVEGESIFESEDQRKDGSRVPVEVHSRTLELGGKRYILSVGRDISERKRVESEIARFKTVSDLATYGITMLDRERKIIYSNRTCGQLHGYEPEELIGRHCTVLVPEEELGYIDAMFERSDTSGGFVDEEIIHIRKDGTLFPTLMTGVTVKGEDGEPLYTSVLFLDITDRKKMQEQLIVTDRLASLGELAAGIAHEINNPLTGVVGFSDLLMTRKDLPEDIQDDLVLINKEALRASQVAKHLLTFARKHPDEKNLVNINESLNLVLEMRSYEQKVHNINVVTDLAENLSPVLANEFQLQQVFINIIINAEQFMIEANGKGTLSITTEVNGDTIRVSVSDDGPGINPEHLPHIFDPFYTTKEVGKGTGLGLSICYGIITEIGGEIYVSNQPCGGATFVIELPVHNEQASGRR